MCVLGRGKGVCEREWAPGHGSERGGEGEMGEETRTGTSIFWNIAIPLRTSASATSCGVDTTTAPSTQHQS